jgi:hypothetical protein
VPDSPVACSPVPLTSKPHCLPHLARRALQAEVRLAHQALAEAHADNSTLMATLHEARHALLEGNERVDALGSLALNHIRALHRDLEVLKVGGGSWWEPGAAAARKAGSAAGGGGGGGGEPPHPRGGGGDAPQPPVGAPVGCLQLRVPGCTAAISSWHSRHPLPTPHLPPRPLVCGLLQASMQDNPACQATVTAHARSSRPASPAPAGKAQGPSSDILLPRKGPVKAAADAADEQADSRGLLSE